MTEPPDLPQRVYGTHLPAAAYKAKHRAVGAAQAPRITDERWDLDEGTLQLLLDRLRQWQVSAR